MPPSSQTDGMDPPVAKRQRLDKDQIVESARTISIRAMLLVPNELVFRRVQDKPLLTCAEAQCFLRVSFLAQEMDSIVQAVESILMHRKNTILLRKKLDEIKNPMAHPIRIISTIFENQTVPALRGMQKALSELLVELSSCSAALRQSAEQNWSVSESLVDAMMGYSNQVFAEEKRNLAELEEEIGRRIDALVGMAMVDYPKERRRYQESMNGSPETTRRNLFASLAEDARDPWKESLQAFCSKMFALSNDDCNISQQNEQSTMKKAGMYPFTQPEQNAASTSQDSAEDAPCDMQESQNSYRKKSSAAEVLANLAQGAQMN